MKYARDRASVTRSQRIKVVCQGFERDWQSGIQPQIEDYLGSAAGQDRSELLAALLGVELKLLTQQGSTPPADAYQTRFPNDTDLIAEVFAEAAGASAGGLTCSLNDTSISRQSGPMQSDLLETQDPPATADQEATVHSAPGSRDTSVSRKPGLASGDLLETQDAPSAREAGQKIGRFEILQVLGQGAFGRVYRAHDPQLAREVALKVPLRETLQTEAEVQRFLGEARAAATIRHPNICPVYEVGQDGNQYFIVMAFVEGKALAGVLEERPSLLPVREAVQLVRTLAQAMAVAHGKGIVHRDLKPANIMFDRDSGEAVIMDFGLARRREPGDAGQTQEGMILGTPAYMPPEQASGKVEAVGPHSDIYTLGVILYELLCGQRPFSGTPFEILGKVQYVAPTPPSKHRKSLDARLESICLKAMAKEPARRFSSMKQLADTLGHYLVTASGEVSAPPSGETGTTEEVEATGGGTRRPPWQWLAGAGLLAVVLIAGIGYFARTPSTKVSDVQQTKVTSKWFGMEVEKRDPNPTKTDASLKSEPPENNPPAKTEPVVPKAEPAPQSDWVSLFNGKDFTGWTLDSGSKDAWQVVNGAIVTRGTGGKTRGWLLSHQSYADFQLKCQFQLGSDADGGIGIRAVSGETINTSPMHLAIKLRTIPVPAFKVETGSLYYWVNTAEPPLRPAVIRSSGSWNDLFIEMRGQELRIEVNNQEIQNLDLNKIAMRPQVMPGVKRTSGRIGLQQHSGQVSFRDIQIKDLTKPAPPPKKPDLAPATAWVPLFNGKDLTGWRDANQQAAFWTVQNGTLYYTGNGGTNLVTTKNYKNFEMKVDWKIPMGGDSGVYLRGQPQIQIWDNKEGSGGLWNNRPGSPGKVPLVVADNPIGAWNTMWVRMIGDRVTVKLNDRLVVDNALLLDGKVPAEGPLELQKHRSAAWFKNIYVKELE